MNESGSSRLSAALLPQPAAQSRRSSRRCLIQFPCSPSFLLMKDANPRAIRRGRDQSEKCDRRLLSAAVFAHDVREYALLTPLSTQWPDIRLATVLSPT